MELTNLVVNRTAENITKAFGDDIEKARHGVYTDTPENRRLRRVGQKYGSKKGEEAPKGRPQVKQEEPKQKGSVKKEEPKDERFSADGIVGKDGLFNKKGASYNRWSALREKVETGKATPEEKKEFARIHNQYLNEKSRSEYERNKATDPKAKEPKYETVEERTARVKGDKEAKAAKESWDKVENEIMKNSKTDSLTMGLAGIAYDVFDNNEEISNLINHGYEDDSPEITKLMERGILERALDYADEITYSCKKYGTENTVKFLHTQNDGQISEALAKKIVAKCVDAKHSEKKGEGKSKQDSVSEKDFNSISDFFSQKDPYDRAAFTYVSEDVMDEKEFKKFMEVANQVANDENLSEHVRDRAKAWAKLAIEERQ